MKESLRVDIDGSVLAAFQKIQMNNPHLKRKTEVVRFCIQETASDHNFSLTDQQMADIRSLFENEYIRNRFQIYSVHQFVYKAIEHYYKYLEGEIKSLRDLSVRKHLSDIDNRYASAFLKLQDNAPDKLVSAKQLADHLGIRKTTTVTNKLEEFYTKGYIERRTIGGEYYYFTD